ncbi:hypothetical protein AA0312_2255 [Acetobacter tropicalis NRIC 0312]|uniref:Uncharacterized protein n=1 Tax=Acetobacter tropicalis TaxID=104102 RepID=A0A511FLD7_9PROT|nr:hypothetical protein ATR1_068c0058 [Acetobacter tropicalis]GBR71317.1 hypothetical protein AA0312_2255 [Acetobacter tropicalis NRIC 0312]GEL50053.1 hypothetical protein ATR01nite_11280 [Acetobacter tropicalis]
MVSQMNMVFVAYGPSNPATVFVPVPGRQIFQKGKKRGGDGQKMFPGSANGCGVKFVEPAAGEVMRVCL